MFEKEIAKNIKIDGMTAAEIENMFETPKDESMGDVALPCFKLSKVLRKSPVAIAEELKNSFTPCDEVEEVNAVSGYLNFKISPKAYLKHLIPIVRQGEAVGSSDEGRGKTICIDYSSVNIAKPFHIGHLSTTVIGGALYRIFSHLGYKTVGINHLGDWGTQFGKMIVAYLKWGDRSEVEKGGVLELNRLYVKFHKEAESDPSLDDEARAWFKKIEDGKGQAMELFLWFKEITLAEVSKVYDRLKIKFDSYNGESFYNDKMQPVLDMLDKKGLLEVSDGAKVVNLDAYDMPPCLLVKGDGATLYATRDLAAAYYRAKTYDFYKCLYVVAYQQNLHFKQLFKVLELAGFEKAADMEHIAFGMVSLEDGAMKTRLGRVVWLSDVLDKAVEKAKSIICEKKTEGIDVDKVSEAVGVGAVVFSALWNNRIKDIVFSFDKVLNFDGETAPYVQYTHARCCSLLKKGGTVNLDDLNLDSVANDEGIAVIKSLISFADSVKKAATLREPCYVSRHIVDLAEKFNRFYIAHKIASAEEGLKNARLILTLAVKNTIKTGLSLLGIDAPEAM